MDDKLARQVVTLPSAEVTQPGFDAIPQAVDNTPLWDTILKPLLDLAGNPIQIGTLIFTLSQLFEKFERYQREAGPAALASFAIMSEELVDEILSVLIPNEELCDIVANEFVAQDLARTTEDDSYHGCEGK